MALPGRPPHGRSDASAHAAGDRHVRRGIAEPERRTAAAGRAVEVRVQEHQVHCRDPLRRQDAGDHVVPGIAGVVRVLFERQPRPNQFDLPGPGHRAPARRVSQPQDAAVQRIRRPGRVPVRGDGPAEEFLTAMTPNRWRIPLGAVAVHICIGSVYAWSTFNRPIQALFPDNPWWFSPPYTTFTTALVLLGLSAAFAGPWVERRGPRVAATASALFFGAGLIIGGIGLATRQSLLVFLGMGVIGGIGCGLGYIAPVSTLVKWFPDRRGMATGMAIMGFGGGAFIAGYLNVFLMDRIGVANTVMALGVAYLAIMLLGS